MRPQVGEHCVKDTKEKDESSSLNGTIKARMRLEEFSCNELSLEH